VSLQIRPPDGKKSILNSTRKRDMRETEGDGRMRERKREA
jgi:hypothetical protein